MLECIVCGKVLTGYQRVCCSRSCSASRGGRALHDNTDMTGKNNPNWKGGWEGNRTQYKNTYYEKNPQIKKAHDIVRTATLNGELTPQSCEICESTDNIHAHHDDYSKPLTVRWLCETHHKEWHRKN